MIKNKYIFTIAIALVYILCYSATSASAQEQDVETIPFQMVEQKPSFNGGDANDFSKWVMSHIIYPENAKANGIEGRVTLAFTVGADGKVGDVRVLRGFDSELDAEAIRVVTSSPSWSPGRQKGQPVNVSFTYPVVFSIPGIEMKIEDPGFRSYCLNEFDTNKDGKILKEEAEVVTNIYLYNKNIQSLKGIECFVNLVNLNCTSNQLTTLDVSNNTKLRELCCGSNRLTRLDVSKNIALERLRCFGNQLTSLDVSKNTALRDLDCWDNQLTNLDVSKNTALTKLDCGNNHLTNLDISKNVNLSEIKTEGNPIKNLNAGKNTKVISSRTSSNNAAEENEIITFSTPMDVFNFLQSRVFKSSNGVTLDISPYGVTANGRAITGAVQVTYIQRQQAILKATSPTTGHTYTFYAYADKNCIVCSDDNTMYFGKKY